MKNTNELKDCRIILKDAEHHQMLADTKILAFDSDRNAARISVSSLLTRGEKKIAALVFHRNGEIHEYFGQLKNSVISNEVEVMLGAARKRTDRGSERYGIETAGVAEGILIGGQPVYLRKPIPVITKNMSLNGVLIQATAGSFERGMKIILKFQLGDAFLNHTYKVVRIQNSNQQTEEYGCMIAEQQAG